MAHVAQLASLLGELVSAPLRMRRVRRTVCTALQPFIDRSLAILGPVAEKTWRDSYLTGFLIVAITDVAQRSGTTLDSDALARTQTDCWRLLTGVADPEIGERITLMSLARDPDFLTGCHDGADWVQKAEWHRLPSEADIMAEPSGLPAMSEVAWAGWEATALRRMDEVALQPLDTPPYS